MTNEKTNKFKEFLAMPAGRAFIALVLILVIGLIFNGGGAFFKTATHFQMLGFIAPYALLACGMTLVIITGGIDLSVGSTLGLSSVCFALFTIHMDMPTIVAIPLCMLIGTLLGLTSGALIGRFKMQPFIATLAMMVFARGLAKVISGGQKVTTAVLKDGQYTYKDEPEIFDFLNGTIMGDTIYTATIIFLICAVICWVLLRKLRWGRYLYAIGGNEESARLSGIPVVGTKLLAYGLCGLLSALAGICQCAMETQGDPEAGVAYELQAIAIVVIGGTSLMGGRGGIMLTVIGALIIGYLEKILSINAVGESYRLMLTGLIIIGAVLFQRSKRNR